jgi:hypothetical protein
MERERQPASGRGGDGGLVLSEVEKVADVE